MKYFEYLAEKQYGDDGKRIEIYYSYKYGPFSTDEEIKEYVLSNNPGQKRKIFIFDAEIKEIIPTNSDEELKIALDLATNNTRSSSNGGGSVWIPDMLHANAIFKALQEGRIREYQAEVYKKYGER